jgi:hypothetical protein
MAPWVLKKNSSLATVVAPKNLDASIQDPVLKDNKQKYPKYDKFTIW